MSLEIMAGSWPVLLPGATYELMALQQQGFVATQRQADVPVLGCHQGHIDVCGLCRSSLIPHIDIMGELATGEA